MSFNCAGCGNEIEDGQTVIELVNGIFDPAVGEVPPEHTFGLAVLHAGSGEADDEPDCLTPANVARLFDATELDSKAIGLR